RKSKTSTRASKSARVTNAAISFVARPLIARGAQWDEGPPVGDPHQAFCRIAGLTVAPCHAALHAASHARPGALCAAFAAAPSRPSEPQPVTASEIGPPR